MINNLLREINVDIRPVKMAGRYFFDVQYRLHGLVQEPGKLLVGKEHLFAATQQRESTIGNVRDLNIRGGLSRRRQVNGGAPQSVS